MQTVAREPRRVVPATYNSCMNHASEPRSAWSAAARSAVLDRWTLLSNHVLRAEPQATTRLSAHAGRVIAFEPPSQGVLGWPAWLASALVPDVGIVRWALSNAGLLERLADVGDPGHDLSRPIDAHVALRPAAPWDVARALALGDASVFDVHGDEAVCAEVRWVLDHVRWDVAGDVGRVLPQPLQAPAARVADVMAEGFRRGARTLDAWWPRPGEQPPPR